MTVSLTCDDNDNKIIAQTPFQRGGACFKDICRSIPTGRWEGRRRVWTFQATPWVARTVLRQFRPHLRDDDEVDESLYRLSILARSDAVWNTPVDDLPQPENRTGDCWDHQKLGFHLVCSQQATMLDYHMGTGKTKVVIDAICNMPARKILIFGPTAAINDVWGDQFSQWASCQMRTVKPSGSVKQRTDQIKDAMAVFPKEMPTIALINYEATRQKCLRDYLLSQQWGMVVCDESHRIKAPGGKDSRFFSKLRDRASIRVCLTGTPMAHSPLDVYGQYRFLDPGIYGSSFARFRAQYAVMGGWGGKQVIDYQHLPELREKFYSIGHKVERDEVLDLPPIQHVERKLSLSTTAREAYKSLENHFVAELEGGVVTAANALSKLLRLQQVTSGFASTEDLDTGERSLQEIDTGKKDAVAEILDDLPPNEPVIIFCRFNEDVSRCVSAVGDRPAYQYTGGVKQYREWRGDAANDKGAVLVCQIQAASLGIDFTAARYAIYYSLGFSLSDYQQSIARLHRPGQEKSVEYIHLIAKNTVDQRVYRGLQEREEIIQYVLNGYSPQGEDDERTEE